MFAHYITDYVSTLQALKQCLGLYIRDTWVISNHTKKIPYISECVT